VVVGNEQRPPGVGLSRSDIIDSCPDPHKLIEEEEGWERPHDPFFYPYVVPPEQRPDEVCFSLV
jgi:hypothetical protein